MQSQIQLFDAKVENIVYVCLNKYIKLVKVSTFLVGQKMDFYKSWKTKNIQFFVLFKIKQSKQKICWYEVAWP